MSGSPSISDVADRADVSKSTVSAVINNKSSVGSATREKVLGVIEELGYRPRGEKHRLIKKRHHRSIGFILKEAENPFFGHIAKGIREYVRQRDFALYMASSEASHEAEVDLAALLESQGIEGLVISPALGERHDLSYLFDLHRRGYPFVLLEDIPGLSADVVEVNSREVIDGIVRFLLDEGHEDIVHLAGPSYSAHAQERIDGFVRGFSKASVSLKENQLVRTGAHVHQGYNVSRRIIEEKGPSLPSALICYNDQVAVGAAKAFSEHGVDIPEELVIIGHDNLELLDYYPIPISSVEVSTDAIGEKAAELLLEQIEGKADPTPTKISWPAELIMRSTDGDATRYEVSREKGMQVSGKDESGKNKTES